MVDVRDWYAMNQPGGWQHDMYVPGEQPKPPPEQAILQDLIAVLRDEHRPYQGCAHDCCRECSTCREAWPCETSKELDRAEERLRELSGDE